jgi:predicted ABC-type ATPase
MPNVIVIAGPNGSGKSTTAPDLLHKVFMLDKDKFINADNIALELPAVEPAKADFKAGRIMLGKIHNLEQAGADFAFETTLASRSFAPWLRTLQQKNYIVHLIYLWLHSEALAVGRVAERVRRGGHDIPEPVIRRRYKKSLYNFFNLYRPIADSWLMMDNSQLPEPRPVAWRNTGGPLQIVKSGPWEELRKQYEKDIFDKK